MKFQNLSLAVGISNTMKALVGGSLEIFIFA